MVFSSEIAYSLLKKISREIDEYFKVTYTVEVARSTDIYDFIKKRKLMLGEFSTGRDFNRFLRKVHDSHYDLFKKIIPNSNVDCSNPKFYTWRFYRKEIKKSNEVKAESVITPSKYYKETRNILTNNNDLARSQQEKYIYDRLLNEQFFKVFYEEKSKGDSKLLDFKVWNRLNNKIYRWEHFGMLENSFYAAKAAEKIQWYKDKGFDFIENGGRLIVTSYRNEHEFHNDIERIISLIKEL
ncbi:hypothetical protein D3C87_40120 [compost metagenome]